MIQRIDMINVVWVLMIYCLFLAAITTFSLTASRLLYRTRVSGLRVNLHVKMYSREQSANGRWWSCKSPVSNMCNLRHGMRCPVQVLLVGVSSLEGAVRLRTFTSNLSDRSDTQVG
jgi:hypothetical protein